MAVENDSVAQKPGFNGWAIVQTAIAGFLVTGVLALAGMVSGLRDTVRDHDLLMGQIQEFHASGGRYTEDDGLSDREASISRYTRLEKEVEKMTANQVRYWEAMRDHIAIPEHQGAKYRLNSLEEHFGGLKVLEFKGK